jgi:hypothetical protein
MSESPGDCPWSNARGTGSREEVPESEVTVRPVLIGALAVAGAALVLFAAPSRRPDGRPVPSAPAWEDAEAVAWADADQARIARELDAQCRDVAGRVVEKLSLTDQLIRGERTLGDVAARFRELDGPSPASYRFQAKDHPTATEEELAYRQVLTFVRRSKSHPALVPAVLPALEAELAQRFPSAAALPKV